MEPVTSRDPSIEEWLTELEDELHGGSIKPESFRGALEALERARLKLLDLVEHSTELDRNNAELGRLYRQMAGHNASTLIDKLRGYGYYCKTDQALRDVFEKQGYRLLEQTRTGKRQDVFYGLLRVFISLNREISPILIEPFKPVYSADLFKVFMFSFFSGVLGSE